MPPKKRRPDSDSEDVVKKSKKKKKGENGSHFDEDLGGSDNEETPFSDLNTPITDDDLDDKVVNEGSSLLGEVLISGGTNWDLIGRHKVPKDVKNGGGPNLWRPHRIGPFMGITVRAIISGCQACHSVIVATDGKAYTWGRNDKGQLGHGDTLRRDLPTLVECLNKVKIVDGACGKNHTLLLSDKGRVFSFGDNKMGQLGLGHQSAQVPSPTEVRFTGSPIRKVSCGGEFSMMSTMDGKLYSFGHPEYGQLGNNKDGKYFVTSNKLSYSCETKPQQVSRFIEKTRDGRIIFLMDVLITDVKCGTNHAIAVDAKKRVFTWGFGGYGRLGHNETKDEMIPRLVKAFDGPMRGAVKIAAGSSFSMVVTEPGVLYLFGQNKPTGEAAMYPKPVQDLTGWNVRSVACCNKSIVCVADESVVAWGPSPTYGELGYGENKPRSSTTPQEVKTLEGLHIHNVSCGYGHSLMLARVDTDEDKAKIEKLPVFTGK